MAFTKIRAIMTKLSDNFPFLGTVTGTTIADNSITNAKFASTIAASNFSGALPAIDGSALTGLSATTTSASDPLITTNGTLGDVFINTTSGETYVCTDATTDNNVWTNVGAGTADVVPYYPGGTVASYQWSGQTGGQFTIASSIERIPYASENGTATGASTLFAGKFNGGGADDASGAHGYMMWGMTKASYDVGSSQIQKYAHASSVSAVQTGNMNDSRTGGANYHQDEINMYLSAGYRTFSNSSLPYIWNTDIEKVSFASPSSATVIGSVDDAQNAKGTSSGTHGYCPGGHDTSWAHSNVIKRFSFASDGDAVTMTGVLHRTADSTGAWMDSANGWRADYPNPTSLMIDGISKYSHTSDTDAVATSDLTWAGYGSGWAQSETKGYWLGAHFSAAAGNRVSAFTFASESDQALVGTLQINRYGAGGTNGSA